MLIKCIQSHLSVSWVRIVRILMLYCRALRWIYISGAVNWPDPIIWNLHQRVRAIKKLLGTRPVSTSEFRIEKNKNVASPTGNRTRVSHVTGEDTHHYTIEDADFHQSCTTYDDSAERRSPIVWRPMNRRRVKIFAYQCQANRRLSTDEK